MKNKLYLCLMAVLSLLVSCISDDSTISDDSINITISGIESSYNIVSFSKNPNDKLVISPVVTSNLASDDLEYSWSYYDAKFKQVYGKETEKYATHFNDSKDIDEGLSLPEGEYVFFLTVTSKSTGYKQFASTTVYTSCDISKGFIVLKENADGNSDYDLLNTSNNSFVGNVISTMQGEAVPGKPRHGDVIYYFAYQNPENDRCAFNHCYCVTTENNEVRWIRISDGKTVMDADNCHFEKMDGEIPYRTVRGYFSSYFLTNNGVWSGYCGSYASMGILGSAAGNGGSTHCVTSAGAFYSLVYWDEQTRSIAMSDYNGGHVPGMSMVPGFEVENTNYDCITCGNNSTMGENIYFLLKDRSNGKLYMYYIDCSMWMPALSRVEELDSSSNFANASCYATCCSQATIAYGVRNNKLYAYDLAGTQTERELTVPGLPSGETITYVSNRFYNGLGAFDYFIIGTQSGSNYHVYCYKMVGGEPVGSPEVTISGEGILHSVDYVEPSTSEYTAQDACPILDK